MAFGLDERTPLKHESKRQQPASFVTGRFLLGLVIASLGWAFLGFLLHEWHLWRRPAAQVQVPARMPAETKALEVQSASPKPTKPRALNTTEHFLKCNPSVTILQAVSVRGGWDTEKGRGKTPLDGGKCTSEKVAVIREALDRLKYKFEATVPDPYSYPADVLKVLLALQGQELISQLESYEKTAMAMGNLGALVKFFAWGLPAHAEELGKALGGDDVVDALMKCNIMRQCGMDSVYTSSVQLLPIRDTTVVVATDWPVPTVTRYDEQRVEVVDLNTMHLAQNIPISTGLRVLDLGSTGGVLAMVAAYRGATEVSSIQPNPRGAKFVRFNSWLNHAIIDKVKVYENTLEQAHDVFKNELKSFYLVLAHPGAPQKEKDGWAVEDLAVRTALDLSRNLLSDSGSLVMAVEGQACESFSKDYNRQLCGDDEHGDLTGSVVCRSKDSNDHDSQESIIYAWRGARQEFMETYKCGSFDVYHTEKFDGVEGPEACNFARAGMKCLVRDSETDTKLKAILSAG